MSSHIVSNNNLSSGAQKNFSQTGGSHNTRFNADTINYHREHDFVRLFSTALTVAAQERTRSPPPPSSTVPFHRDPHFVDRPQLEELEQKFPVWNKRVALVGLGGVGKSQLAIEFCYRVRDRSPEVWTFWVHASSASRFDADIRKLACDVEIPGYDDPKSDTFALVYSWLRDKRNGKWILVLDNVDDPDYLFKAQNVSDESGSNQRTFRNRMAYLPPCTHGSILITSRSRTATARLTDECDVITISPMDEANALALLEKKLGQSSSTEDMQKLAAALDYMPLALAQAGAYIKQRGSRCSVEQYLAKLQKSEKSQTSLLASASKETRRDQEAKDSIILTWQISFDHICATRPSAADLLSLMSMYNNQGIPEYLLRTRVSASRAGTRPASKPNIVERDSDVGAIASEDEDFDEDDFEDDILTLKDFHFISTMFSNTVFEMHRLVQLAARVWLRTHGSYEKWAQVAIGRLDEAFPNGKYENWGRCGELYPHVTSTSNLQLDDQVASLRGASIQYKTAWFNWERGLRSKAEALVAKSYSTRNEMLGPEDEKTLLALGLHASILSDQGKYEAAEEANRQVLEVYEKVLGKEHPSTLWSRNNLTAVLTKQKKYEAAEEANRQVLEVSEKVLGKEHPSTLTSRINRAVVLTNQRNYKAAEEIYRQSLEVVEKVLGEEHPVTLKTRQNLASLLIYQEKYDAAEELARQVLEASEKVLGKEHPRTLRSVRCLAHLMDRRGETSAAVLLCKRATAGFLVALGSQHPDTVECQRTLAKLQHKIELARQDI